jgi:hypothetical protein
MPGYVKTIEDFTNALLTELHNNKPLLDSLNNEKDHLLFCRVYCVVRSIYEAGRTEGFEECRTAILKTIAKK